MNIIFFLQKQYDLFEVLINLMLMYVMHFYLLLFIFFSTASYSFDKSYSEWDGILKKFTVLKKKQVLVDYKRLKDNPKELNDFLKKIENLTKPEFKKFTEKEKLAFWINTYNAFTFRLIIKNYPIKSIKDIGWFFSTPWKINFINIFGKEISLDDIEHGVIRKNFKEARIHFALNCASIGCPSLYQNAFVAEKLDAQLNMCTKNFLQNTRKNIISKKTMYLSKVFDWFEEDFVKYHGSVQSFIGKLLNIKDAEKKELKFINYDWKLNITSGQD